MSPNRTSEEKPARRLPPDAERRFHEGVAETSEFFMGQANVQKAMAKLVELLEKAGIPYAIIGAMALNEYGYRRATVDVDVLLTTEGLDAFKSSYLGRGYVERFAGSRGMKDTEHNVEIDVVLAGDYPGDGKPKPVVFPDPAASAERGEHVALLPLESMLELKLASGITAPHRLRDLADVLEVIRALDLPRELGDDLSPYVQKKYAELWEAAQGSEPER